MNKEELEKIKQKALQEHIVSVNKREHFAILNIEFLNRRIKAGIEMQDKEI